MTEGIELPQNIELESEILGLVMRDNSVMERLNFLAPEDFYVALNQKIFAVCREKIDNGQLVTPLILKNYFESDPDFPPAYLAKCAAVSASPFHAHGYAIHIKELASRRELIAACESAKTLAAKEGNDLRSAASDLSGLCEKIVAGGKKWELRPGSVVTQEIINNMNRGNQCYSTGIRRLDKAMDGGLAPRNLYGFAGKQKSGKTILAGTISVNLAMAGVKHLFICAEMGDVQIHQRNLARTGKFFTSVFRESNGYSQSADFKQKFSDSMKWDHDNIIFVNAPALTFQELKYYVKLAVQRYGVKGYILDYWQLVGGAAKGKLTSEHYYEVAQWMAASTKEHDIFAIATVQLNQEGNTFGSEGIRKACDQLYEINRPKIERPEVWLKMMDTRHTAYMDIGSENNPKLALNSFGPHIEESPDDSYHNAYAD